MGKWEGFMRQWERARGERAPLRGWTRSIRSSIPKEPAMESTSVLTPSSVSPRSLAAAFAQVPDPRRAASVVYPLAAILGLAVAALLANHRSVLAIAEWGARQDTAMLTALGF